MIAATRICKDFGRTRAIRDVSFQVAAGEIVGLLGPNGSGKTTIMRILTGYFAPTSGQASVAGLDVSRHPLEVRARIGYMAENVLLYPDMRVDSFLAFCARARGLSRSVTRRRIEAVLGECGLHEVRRRLIGKLSKGFRQRVGLAQALLHDPDVLILDEPTVGLDPRQVVEIRELIRGLRGKATVLLSSHILPEVAATCERVIIIHRGRIIAEDSAAALARRLHGGERTSVRLDGPLDEAAALLAAVPGVHHVEPPDGSGRFILYADSGDPVRAQIASAVVRKGWRLLELAPAPVTLEDLFVHLVDGEDRGGLQNPASPP